MSYGLYDGDLKLYPQVPFFNLELMKLSTYYKHKRQMASFSPKFHPEKYTHFIIRQDYPIYHPYSNIYSNLEFGGRAFDGQTYKPLNIDIELSKPNNHLYDKIETRVANNILNKRAFSTMRRAEHVRLSLDGQTINPNWDKQLRYDSNCFGIIFHDYDLGSVNGAYNLIIDNLSEIITNSQGARIGMKFPVQVNTEEDLVNWLQLNALNQYYSLQYNGILTTNCAFELQESTNSKRQIVTNPLYNLTYKQFINEGIISLFKSILNLRRYRLVFPLIYDKAFFIDKRWVGVLELLDFFIKHIQVNLSKDFYYYNKVPYETLYSWVKKELKKDIKYCNACISTEATRNTFQFVRESNYELFKLFYEYTGELQ